MKEPGYIALVSLLILLVIAMIIFGVFAGDMYKLHKQGKKLWLQDEELSVQDKKKPVLLEYSDMEVQSAISELGEGIAEIARLEEQFSGLKNVVEKTVASEVVYSPHDLANPDNKVYGKNLGYQESMTSTLAFSFNDKCQPVSKVDNSSGKLSKKVQDDTNSKSNL